MNRLMKFKKINYVPVKKTITTLCLLLALKTVTAQDLNIDYLVIPIHKKVIEISANAPHQSPLMNYIACIHLWVEGKYAPLYSEVVDCVNKTKTTAASPEYARQLLHSAIEEAYSERSLGNARI